MKYTQYQNWWIIMKRYLTYYMLFLCTGPLTVVHRKQFELKEESSWCYCSVSGQFGESINNNKKIMLWMKFPYTSVVCLSLHFFHYHHGEMLVVALDFLMYSEHVTDVVQLHWFLSLESNAFLNLLVKQLKGISAIFFYNGFIQ